jgi:MFS family permease
VSLREADKKGNFLNVYIASAASFLTDISTEMVYPLLPIFLTSVLGAAYSIVGLIEGIAESTATVLKVFSGYLSDRLQKRKPLAILGYSLSTIGKLFLYVAFSWPLVLLGRFVDRLGKGIRTAPRDALISESVDPGNRGMAFGLHRTFDTLGAAAGVLLSYLILNRLDGSFSIRSIFLISLIPAFLGVLVLFFLKEPRSLSARANFRFSFRDFGWPLKMFLLISFIFSLGNSSDQFLLLRAKQLGASTNTILLIYLAFNAAYALISYPAGKLSDRIGRRRIVVPGYLFYALVYFIVARARSLRTMWTAFILYGFYKALTEGVERALVSDFSSEEIRATAIGAHAMVTGIGLFPASLFAGLIWDRISPSAAFYFGSIMSLLAGVSLWLLLYTYEPRR